MSAKDYPPGFGQDAKNLAIDFDGVIHNFNKGYHDGTCYGDPIEGSLEALKRLSEDYNIIIFTAKAKPSRPLVNGKTGTELVEDWLRKYDVLQYVQEITAEKPGSQIYIDDKGYHFQNWADTLEHIEENL